MYLGMGWSCALCFPTFIEVLPKEAVQLIVLGGVAYTGGVPFFVRNNNLDHSIWHCFVMAGGLLHWLAVYIYVTPL
jgi:hemolysin III